MINLLFVERLKTLRESAGISQEELAKKIGLKRVAVTNYENGVRMPNLVMIVKIAEYFNVTTDYLLGKERHSKPEYADAIERLGLWNKNIDCLNKLQTLIEALNQEMATSQDASEEILSSEYFYYTKALEITNIFLYVILKRIDYDMVYLPQEIDKYLKYTVGGLAKQFAEAPLKCNTVEYNYTEEDASRTEAAFIKEAEVSLMDEFKSTITAMEDEYRKMLNQKGV